MENKLLNNRSYRKEYRVAGIVLFAVAIMTLVARIVVGRISGLLSGLEAYKSEFILDVIFSVSVQVLVLFVMPFLIYKIALKKSVRDIFKFSSFRKTKAANLAISLGIGVTGIFVTMGISFAWLIFLLMLGYLPQSSATILPDNFNFGMLLGSLFLTAVLPAFCEEFTMRGGFLTSIKKALPLTTVIVVSAISFGLFHQYIIQTFYTACFGALMAFLTIKTKSIYPAMIVHFTNNGLSVYLDYASKYGWLGGNLDETIINLLMGGNSYILLFAFGAICLVFIMLVRFIASINPKAVIPPLMRTDAACDQTLTPHANGIDSYIVEKAPPLELDRQIAPRLAQFPINIDPYSNEQIQYGQHILYINNRYYLLNNNVLFALKPKPIFKPSLKDNAFYFGALAVSILSTIFTFAFGIIM